MINGLWQLAGGHDEKVDIAAAAEAMKSLYELLRAHRRSWQRSQTSNPQLTIKFI